MPAKKKIEKKPTLFSYSKAKTIILRSAAHLRAEMDGLTKKPKTDKMIRGLLMEQLITGKADPRNKLAILPFDDFRNQEAKEAKAAAELGGEIPVKESVLESYRPAAKAVVKQFEGLNISTKLGIVQKKLSWNDTHGNKCVGYADRFITYQNGGIHIYDYKCVDNASPSYCENIVGQMGYAIQQAAYVEAAETMYPKQAGRIKFYFLFYEPDPPYVVTKAALDGQFEELGRKQWQRAGAIWKEALKTDYWPGYTEKDLSILMPRTWMVSQEMDKEEEK